MDLQLRADSRWDHFDMEDPEGSENDDRSEGEEDDDEDDNQDDENITEMHLKILRDAKSWSFDKHEDVEKQLHLDERITPAYGWRGERGRTLLQLLADEWTDTLIPLFRALMQRFPELYKTKDELGRTVLSTSPRAGGQRSSPFLEFFVSTYPDQSSELVRNEPELFGHVINANVPDSVLEKIVNEATPELLRYRDRSGKTLLHLIVKAAYNKRPTPLVRAPELLELASNRQPEMLADKDKKGRTPYGMHLSYKKDLEEARARALLDGLSADKSKDPAPSMPTRDKDTQLPLKKSDERPQKPGGSIKEGKKELRAKPRILRLPSPDRLVLGSDAEARRKPVLVTSGRRSTRRTKSQGPSDEQLEKVTATLVGQMYRHLETDQIAVELSGEGCEFDLNLTEARGGGVSTSNDTAQTATLAAGIEHLNLHPHLRYVLIPQCNTKTDELSRLFSCLKERGVRRISRLEVDEDVLFPHSDEVISSALNGLEIRELSWRKTDMSLMVVWEHPEIKDVELYTSGRDMVFWAWSSEKGKACMHNLERIHFTILPLVETTRAVNASLQALQYCHREAGFSCSLSFRFLEPQKQQEYTTWAAALRGPVALGKHIQPAKSMPLEPVPAIIELMSRNYHADASPSAPPVGVALIDDGVDIMLLSEAHERIKAGVSWASTMDSDSGRAIPAPWFLSKSGRGTVIAELLVSIFPGVDLYPIRVPLPADQTPTVSSAATTARNELAALTKAIEWATERETIRVILLPAMPSIPDFDPRTGDESRALSRLGEALEIATKREIVILSPASNTHGRIADEPISHRPLPPSLGRLITKVAPASSSQYHHTAVSPSASRPLADSGAPTNHEENDYNADFAVETQGITMTTKHGEALRHAVVAAACAAGVASFLHAAFSFTKDSPTKKEQTSKEAPPLKTTSLASFFRRFSGLESSSSSSMDRGSGELNALGKTSTTIIPVVPLERLVDALEKAERCLEDDSSGLGGEEPDMNRIMMRMVAEAVERWL